MLTPAFEVSQNEEFITLVVKARYAKVSETEIFVYGKMVKFYSKPYFLRLTLPGALVEDGRESADYDADNGVFTIKIPKQAQGEVFEGLDMLTRLMAPTGEITAAEPAVQPLASPDAVDGEDQSGDEEINWEVEQTPCLLDEDDIIGPVKYGFAGRRSGVFSRLQEELTAIVDVPEPDKTKLAERRKLRLQAEQEKFDDEHYLADLFQDEIIQPLLVYKPSWQSSSPGEEPSTSDLILFTEDEQERMRRLPRKEFILDAAAEKEAYMGLVDILFAHTYNNRCTEGENSVESAWTICKLSSALSWLDVSSSLCDVIISSVRRSLCYPLHRHWELAQAVFRDVKSIFNLGRNQILKALLAVHSLLAEDDPHYILNELYITDYCIWIQGQSQQRIASLAESLNKTNIVKSDVNLDLEALELAARFLLQEGEEDEGALSTIEMLGYPYLLQESKEESSLVDEALDTKKLSAAGSFGNEKRQSPEAGKLERGSRDSDDESSGLDESDTTEEESTTSEMTDTDSDEGGGGQSCDDVQKVARTILDESSCRQTDVGTEQEQQNGKLEIVDGMRDSLVSCSDGVIKEQDGTCPESRTGLGREEESRIQDEKTLVRDGQIELSVDSDTQGIPGGVCDEDGIVDSLSPEKKCWQEGADQSLGLNNFQQPEVESACSSSDLDQYCANIDSAGLEIGMEILRLSKRTGSEGGSTLGTCDSLGKLDDSVGRENVTHHEAERCKGMNSVKGVDKDVMHLSNERQTDCQKLEGAGGVGETSVAGVSGRLASLMIEQSRNSAAEGMSSLDSDDDTEPGGD